MSIIIDGIEYYGVIYKIENTITHEVYIGQTNHPKGFDGRYSFKGEGIERVYGYLKGNHNRRERHNQHLRRSIEKYGFDAFMVDKVFDVAFTHDELNQKEESYVRQFDCFAHGYNQTYGGDNYPRGKYCKNSKKICQLNKDGKLLHVWNSATEAAQTLGLCLASISRVCNHAKYYSNGEMRRTVGDWVWVFEKEYDPEIDYSIQRSKIHMGCNAKAVVLLSDDDEIVQEFYSINEASRQLGADVESIRQTCLHAYKHPRLHVMYKNEYMEEQRLNEKGVA